MYNNFQNGQMPAGQIYGNRMPQTIQFTQPLSKEEVENIRKDNKNFSLNVPKIEMDRAICTHKYPESSTFATTPVGDGTGDLICGICGARFNPDDIDQEKVINAVKTIVNILQSIKLLYVNIPPLTAKQYFSMIPFIEKIPDVYKIALDNFQRFNGGANNVTQDVYTSDNIINAYKQITGGYGMGVQPMMYGNQPMYQQCQPQYNPQYQQQYVEQAPFMQPTPQYQMNMPQPNMPVQPNMMATPQFNYGGSNNGNINPFYSSGVGMPNTNGANNNQPLTPPNVNNTQNNGQANNNQPPVNQAIERVNASATLDA